MLKTDEGGGDNELYFISICFCRLNVKPLKPGLNTISSGRRNCRHRFYRSLIHFVYQPRIGLLPFLSGHGVGLPTIDSYAAVA